VCVCVVLLLNRVKGSSRSRTCIRERPDLLDTLSTILSAPPSRWSILPLTGRIQKIAIILFFLILIFLFTFIHMLHKRKPRDIPPKKNATPKMLRIYKEFSILFFLHVYYSVDGSIRSKIPDRHHAAFLCLVFCCCCCCLFLFFIFYFLFYLFYIFI